MNYNIQGMSWLRKISLVLLLTLTASVFMFEGLYSPRPAAAAISTPVAAASAVGTNTPATTNVTIPLSVAGNKRMLVVGITLQGATASTATNAQVTCTYGGTALTAVPNTDNSATPALEHTYLFYMLDNTTLMNNTSRVLTFTVNGFSMVGNSIHRAVYDGVAQVAPTGSTANSGITDVTTISLASPLNIVSGDTGFVVAMTTRSGSTTARTITTPTNWASVAAAAANATSPATNRYCYTSTTVNSAADVALTASGTSRLSISGMVIKMADVTAPVANNNVTATPTVNTYTSATPTITATFTEPDVGSTVTTCEYTTNGSTWSAGTVTGSTPTFTCTANPTGLSGALTINMRATSTGGGPTTSTQITRTVDNTAPSGGTLTVNPGNPQNDVLWTAQTETQSGVNHYDLYFQTGPTAPACGSGTLLYTGGKLMYIHSGLAGSTQYSYRVCATDNMALVSSGVAATVTTPPRPSVINTCSGCHGYPPVDNAARVSGTTGQFQGSHNKHSGVSAGQLGYACTNCHSNNTNLNHANDIINIAVSPGSYSRGTTPALANSFTPGTCSNTYCHSKGTGGTTQSGDIRAVDAITSPSWGGTTACTSCHGTGATDGRPNYTSGTPKKNSHLTNFHVKACTICHDSVTGSTGAYVPVAGKHADGVYNINASMGYTYNVNGGTCATSGCHISAAWGGVLRCIDCHSAPITRTLGRPGATLQAVTGEFGLAFGHKKSGRAAVADADCIVCHLEGAFATQKPSATYHANGNIDLRNPDGTGEAPITNMSNAAWTFSRFSTSYAAGTRTTTGHTANTIDNIITQKFCIACHDSTGASNTSARSNNGGTGTAQMPFGGIALGATYTAANNAIGTQGLIDVKTQFATTNSSVHPVLGPRTKDFPTQGRMVAPYNGFTRVGTAGTTAVGIVLNCFDCHNSNTAPLLTTRTISAHGSNKTVMVRGNFYTTNNTLCTACHSGYTPAGNHGAGSAMALDTGRTDEGFNNNCMNCHGSKTTAPTAAQTRPLAAQDFHGSNSLVGGTLWPTINARPTAFIRGWSGTAFHRARALAGTSGYAAGTAQCGVGTCPTGGAVGDGTTRNYTPGGTY